MYDIYTRTYLAANFNVLPLSSVHLTVGDIVHIITILELPI